MSWDIPNYVILGAEVVVGIGIAWYIHRLQSKTDKIRDDVTDQIKKYTDEQRKHQKTRKKFYIKRLKEILEYIRTQDIEAKNIIADFNRAPQNPNMYTQYNLLKLKDKLEIMCVNTNF